MISEKILQLITELEVEAEKLEPTRRNAMLDMIDSFESAIKTLLNPTVDELIEEMYGPKPSVEEQMDDPTDAEKQKENNEAWEHDQRLNKDN